MTDLYATTGLALGSRRVQIGGYFAWGGCADGAAGASADGPGGLSSDRGVVTFSAKGAPTMRYISM
jgi:hypothetical protein